MIEYLLFLPYVVLLKVRQFGAWVKAKVKR
jgi:hypothetical protein